MNKTEFNDLQNQLGNILYEYERLLKKGFIINLKYQVKFKSYLEKLKKYNEENKLIQQVIIMVNEKKVENEIEQTINLATLKYNKELVNIQNNVRNYESILRNIANISNDNISKMEFDFKNYVLKRHPALKINVSKEQDLIYRQLRIAYEENNIENFYKCFKIALSIDTCENISEEDYSKYSINYYELMEKLKLEIQRLSTLYPYTKENVFLDDMSILHEEAELKINVNNLLGINSSLHKDLLNCYFKDISL